MVIKVKKGQISIYVIVAIVLVVVVVLFFLLSDNTPSIDIGEEFNPDNYIDICLRESVRSKTAVMLSQGGFIEPKDFVLYNNERVTYLCKNINFYKPCISQYPVYLSKLEDELETVMFDEVMSCFIALESELEKRKYDYRGGDIEIEIELKPGKIELNVISNFALEKNGVSRQFETLDFVLESNIYDIAYIANEIVSQEAQFCYFEYVGFMALYPEFDVKKHTMSESTKIYSIKHKSTDEIMNIAIRGCAIPAGF